MIPLNWNKFPGTDHPNLPSTIRFFGKLGQTAWNQCVPIKRNRLLFISIIGTKFCCVDVLHKESIEYLDAQAYTGNKTASDCCDVAIAKFVTNRSESENRTLYYRDEGDPMDPSNPKCEKEFFSGCNVYFVNDSSTCRLVVMQLYKS